MPLKKGSSRKVVSANIKQEMKAGKPPIQAIGFLITYTRSKACLVL